MARSIEAACLSDIEGIRHGFFTREGGVSAGHYASLNCGLGSGDHRAAVVENRKRVAAALGAPGRPVTTLYQVHSATALVVESAFAGSDRPKADALVTRTPGLVIGVLAADCVPVLFADPIAGVIAAAHAGWRGALAGVLEATLDAMAGLDADRRRIRAAVGPCIGQSAYEVGPEFAADFLKDRETNARFFTGATPPARPHFDLAGYVVARLGLAGVEIVGRQTPCTYSNESQFFSFRRATHRKEPDYGRQISAIVVT